MLRRSPLEPLSYERFLETHDVFEAASNQRQRIARWFAGRADARPLRDVVSIGSGGGDLDLEIMRLLAGPRRLCRYVGVDPNPVECARCRASFEQLRPSVEADVVSQSFESAVLPTSAFDLVYAVHTLYYVADVESALRKALGLLRDDGQLVLV
jgi:SAM-dependent methyltransferase